MIFDEIFFQISIDNIFIENFRRNKIFIHPIKKKIKFLFLIYYNIWNISMAHVILMYILKIMKLIRALYSDMKSFKYANALQSAYTKTHDRNFKY